ncbi:MAG TPA: cytochrome-c oxidase, cbb3-type subunit III [Burkholderiaceae bacterium]|nr:cytochrome-c oxidase, cbb3-type subunit III [Burkholderiaceae bacterium]
MSDFYSGFWDYYVAILSLLSIIGCAVFLKAQSKRRVALKASGEPETTDHVWDGDLREYHNPMPRWWIALFYLTIVFALAYLVLFPGLGSRFKGTLKWTSVGQHSDEIKQAEAVYGPLRARFLEQPLPAVAADARGREMGERIFLNNCAQCHGSDAHGSKGFPNLADAEWLYGGEPEVIEASITNGRQGAMPPMAAAVGGPEDVTDVAHYVLSLSDSAHDSVRAARGKAKFAACAACHGPQGKGNPQLGAPDLTNKIWLYGGSVATITETITKGRQGMMPAWKGVLSDAEIHLVAAYVYSLTHSGNAAAAVEK